MRDIKVVIFISLLLTLVIGRNFIFEEGYVYLFENFEVYRVEEFWKVFYPMWNVNMQFFNFLELPKIYIYFPVTALATVFNSYKLLQIILLLVPFPIAFISSFLLSRYLITSSFKANEFQKFISSLLSAFVFTVNPWFVIASRNLFLRIQYSLLPLLIYLFIRILETKERKYVVYFAVLMALISSYRYTFLVSIIFLAVFLFYFLFSRSLEPIKRIALSYALFFFLAVGKFLPALLYSLHVPLQPVQMFDFSQVNRESMLHIFTTKIFEWRAYGFNAVYGDNTYLFFLLVTAFSFSYLLFKPKRKFHTLLPLLLFTFFILLSSKELNLDFIFFNLPLSDFLGRLLRHARWNVMPIVLSISVMCGFSSFTILEKLKRGWVILPLVFLVASVSAWPMFTGDMNSYWKPANPPEDYVRINKILERGSGHVLWFPGNLRRAVWSKQRGEKETSAPMDHFPIRSSSLPSYALHESYLFDYYNFLSRGPGMSPFEVYQGDLEKIYSPLNVNYLAFHYDGTWTKSERKRNFTNDYIKSIARNLKKKKLYEGKYAALFSVRGSGEFTARKAVGVSSGLKTLEYVINVSEEIPGLIFWDKREVDTEILIGDWRDFLVGKGVVISPKKFSKQFLPKEVWSPAFVSDYEFQYRLKWRGIKWNWDLDFGRGVSFTWGRDNLSLPVPRGRYRVFIRYFKNPRGGKMRIHFSNDFETLTTKDNVTMFTWKDLGLRNLDGKMVLENVRGFNAVNVFVLIREEELKELKKSLDNKTILQVLYPEIMYGKNNTYYQYVNLLHNNYSVLVRGKCSSELANVSENVYKLEVRCKDSSFDSVWLLPKGETPERIFSAPHAEISYEEIDPTLWKVKVNSTENFLLTFAEGYDPLWEARFEGKRTRSLPVYCTINGFIIEKGKKEIEVRFVPQEWFITGITISLITFLACILFLVNGEWKKILRPRE